MVARSSPSQVFLTQEPTRTMVVGTRSTPTVDPGAVPPSEVFGHVLELIFGFAEGSPVRLALEKAGIETIADLLTLGSDDIAQLRYSSTDGGQATIALKTLDSAKLKKFGPFHAELCRRRGFLTSLPDENWLTTRTIEWDEFRTNPEVFTPRAMPTAATTPTMRLPPFSTIGGTTTQPTTATTVTTSLRDSFARSIKKDPESYPAFKEARFWDTWNRELTSKAHLHEISDVLDPNFVPATNEAVQLFELQ